MPIFWKSLNIVLISLHAKGQLPVINLIYITLPGLKLVDTKILT